MNIERVVWIDSGFNVSDGWVPVVNALSDFKFDDMQVESVGLLAYEDDEMLGLSTSYNLKSESIYGVQLIAKQNILSREVLRVSSNMLDMQPAD